MSIKYPYTDFHEMNLDWVLTKMKELVEEWADQKAEFDSIKEDWNDLRDFVNNYFLNLDLQDEVNNKINSMIASGQFDSILHSVVDSYTTDINNRISDLTEAMVSADNALNARIDQFTQLEQGSTTGDAELIDARTGANGYVYTTAGEAIRKQIEYLTQFDGDFQSLSVARCKNYYEVDSTGKLYNVAGSTIGISKFNDVEKVSSTVDAFAVKIPLSGVTSITYPVFISTSGYGSFICDDNDNVILKLINSTDPTGTYHTTAVPWNAAYMLLSFNAANATTPGLVVVTYTEPINYSRRATINQKTLDIATVEALIAGPKIIPGSRGGENLNGGYSSGNTIVLPAGSSGYNTYIQYRVAIPAPVKNTPCKAFIIVRPSGYLVQGDEFNFTTLSGQTAFDEKAIVKLRDGRILCMFYFTANDNEYFMNVQVKRTASLTYERTLSVVGAFISSPSFGNSAENEYTTIYTVGPGKMYTSLRTALELCLNGSEHNKYIVEWSPLGNVYEAADDFTAADLDASSTYRGLTVPAYTKLYGCDNYRKNIIHLYLDNTHTSAVRNRFSAINLEENAELENITAIGENVRYAVHDDVNSYNPKWTRKTIRNCRFVSMNTIQTRAYGAGYRSGQKWRFENCIFELTGSELDTNYAAFSAHNNNAFTKPSVIEFHNCRFYGGGAGAAFGSLNTQDSTVINTIIMNGCKCTSNTGYGVTLFNEQGTGCQTSITGSNNSFDNAGVEIRSGDGIDYSDRVDMFNV